MGFLTQDTPVIDFEEWNKGSRAQKIVPMARHWAETGFGTPVALHLFYVVKIGLYILGGWLIALSTKGIDGFTNVAAWWTEPIVFEKVVLYTMLFEVIGLGCGFGPLNNRFFPPMGSILYWLRPGTIRLPPWPNRIPLTRGDARTPFDAALYGALLILLVVALATDGTGPIPELGSEIGVLPVWQTAAILGVLAVVGKEPSGRGLGAALGLAAGERPQLLGQDTVGQAEAGADAAGVALGGVSTEGRKPFLQNAVPAHRLVAGGLVDHLGHDGLLLLQVGQQRVQAAGREHPVAGQDVQIAFLRILRQVTDLADALDRPGIRLAFTGQDAQRRGLAGSVAADQTDPVARLDPQRGTLEGQQRARSGADLQVRCGDHAAAS